jgi:hypothetical protein
LQVFLLSSPGPMKAILKLCHSSFSIFPVELPCYLFYLYFFPILNIPNSISQILTSDLNTILNLLILFWNSQLNIVIIAQMKYVYII